MRPFLEARPAPQRWLLRQPPLLLLTLSGVASGSLLGLVWGAVTLVVLGSVPQWALGGLLALLGLTEVLGRRAPLTQIGKETPLRWRAQGSVRWAMKTGFLLGLGAPTRIGFALWYALPVLAVLLNEPGASMAIFGTYGGLRTGLALAISGALARHGTVTATRWLLSRRPLAQHVSGYTCVVVGLALAVGYVVAPA